MLKRKTRFQPRFSEKTQTGIERKMTVNLETMTTSRVAKTDSKATKTSKTTGLIIELVTTAMDGTTQVAEVGLAVDVDGPRESS
jgi:hypothetical protein